MESSSLDIVQFLQFRVLVPVTGRLYVQIPKSTCRIFFCPSLLLLVLTYFYALYQKIVNINSINLKWCEFVWLNYFHSYRKWLVATFSLHDFMSVIFCPRTSSCQWIALLDTLWVHAPHWPPFNPPALFRSRTRQCNVIPRLRQRAETGTLWVLLTRCFPSECAKSSHILVAVSILVQIKHWGYCNRLIQIRFLWACKSIFRLLSAKCCIQHFPFLRLYWRKCINGELWQVFKHANYISVTVLL